MTGIEFYCLEFRRHGRHVSISDEKHTAKVWENSYPPRPKEMQSRVVERVLREKDADSALLRTQQRERVKTSCVRSLSRLKTISVYSPVQANNFK